MKYKGIFSLIIILLIGAGIGWLLTRANVFQSISVHNGMDPSTALTSTPAIHGTAILLPSPTAQIITGPFVSQRAPAFSLNTLTGDPVKLEDNWGKVVLLNFWTSWCIPCKEEMPTIQAAYEKYRDHGLVVLGINMTNQDDRKAIEKFLQDTGVTFPILLDENGSVSGDYRVMSIPTSFFLDRSGIIQHFQLGPMSAKQLQDYLDEMLPQ